MDRLRETLKCRISEYNHSAEVRESYHFPKEVFIVDSTVKTLQSGASGGYHTTEDLVEIGKAIDQLGVREMMVQLTWQDGLKICEGLARENLNCKLVGTFKFGPHWQKIAEEGIQAGAEEICFRGIMDENDIERGAELCQKRGQKVSHAFPEMYSYQKVVEICKRSITCGYQSQHFADSLSLFNFGINPEAIKYFVSSLLHDIPGMPPIYVHLSNTFGHATLTAAAAIVAGATAPDVTLNGIGHNSGHIPLEEIVMVLECLYGIHTGIDLKKIHDTSHFIQERTGIPVPVTKPIVGDDTFLVDGYYLADEANTPEAKKLHSIFPFSPAIVGSAEKAIWSHRQITPESVKWKLSSMGLKYMDSHVAQIILEVTETLQKKKTYPNWLTDSEFEDLCRSIVLRAE